MAALEATAPRRPPRARFGDTHRWETQPPVTGPSSLGWGEGQGRRRFQHADKETFERWCRCRCADTSPSTAVSSATETGWHHTDIRQPYQQQPSRGDSSPPPPPRPAGGVFVESEAAQPCCTVVTQPLSRVAASRVQIPSIGTTFTAPHTAAASRVWCSAAHPCCALWNQLMEFTHMAIIVAACCTHGADCQPERSQAPASRARRGRMQLAHTPVLPHPPPHPPRGRSSDTEFGFVATSAL